MIAAKSIQRLDIMPPPRPVDHKAFQLCLLKNPFFVKQLEPDATIPSEYLESLTNNSKVFVSITRTDEEISIVGEVANDSNEPEGEANWRCIKIAGPMDFGLWTCVNLIYCDDVLKVLC